MKNYLKYFLYFVIFAAIGVGGAYLFSKMSNPGKTVEVPALTGKSISEATQLLKKRNLLLNIKSSSYDNTVPEGYISQQLQGPGEKIKSGSKVDVIVSSGREREFFAMPSFEGQFLDDAKLTLSNFDIKIEKVTWVHSNSADKGVIIAQRPLPGTTDRNEINFLVSIGPYDVFYKCPPFRDMTINDARTLAKNLGIELIEQGEGTKIVSQKPEPGAMIRKGDTVEVTLGRTKFWF